MKGKVKSLSSSSPLKWFKSGNRQSSRKNRGNCGGGGTVDEIIPTHHGNKDIDNTFSALRQKAMQLTTTEPYMTTLLTQSILHPESTNFYKAISLAIAARLVSSCGNNPCMSSNQIAEIIENAMMSPDLEYGHTMADAVCQDIQACLSRDPACETELEVVLYYKGFAALVCHRAARRYYKTDGSCRFVSLWLQSQASAAFGVDIHPAAEIGAGVFFDHATGLVIGETAKVGDNCTILHGVTLGGTGKEAGDRHPKVGNDVLIGAGTSILGNIKIGDGAKIGAGSIVLKPIPHGSTAVGAPAKIIGWAKENRPGSTVDNALKDIVTAGSDDRTSNNDSNASSVRTESTSSLTTLNHNGKSYLSKGSSEVDNDSTKKEIPVSLIEEKKEDTTSDRNNNILKRRNTDEISLTNDDMCVFRMFSSTCRKPEMLSYKDLRNAMEKNCSEDEIGEVYMELLKNDPSKRHVSKCRASKNFSHILQKYTGLGKDQCEKIRNKLSLD